MSFNNYRRAVCLVFSFFALGLGLNTQASALEIGKLSGKQCGNEEENDQRYWYARTPPYVGFSKGEKTTAGGDGTCYVGFPDINKKSALIRVDGAIVELFPSSSSSRKVIKFNSKNKETVVDIRITGSESTCDPEADKCCGDYTYATITVQKGADRKSIKAVNYVGG